MDIKPEETDKLLMQKSKDFLVREVLFQNDRVEKAQQQNAEYRKLIKEVCGKLEAVMEVDSPDELTNADMDANKFLTRPEVKQILEKEE